MRLSITLAFLALSACPATVLADDLEDSFTKLKQAEEQKDAVQVKALAAEVHALAQQEISAPAPESDEEKANWKKRIEYVKEVDVHAEYSLFAVGTQSAPAVLIDLISTLEKQNPKSKYLDAAYGPYLYALGQTGATAKIPAIAEKAVANLPDNEDILAVLADHYFAANQGARAASYANRLTNALVNHPKREGYSAAEWEKRRSTLLGRGYWIAGVVHGQGDSRGYSAADKELRAALPFIQGNDAMLAPALFYLGVVNYQLGKLTLNKKQVLEAADFSDRATKIKSAYADQAWKNASIMRKDASTMR